MLSVPRDIWHSSWVQDFFYRIHQLINSWLDHSVKNVPSVAAILDQTSFTQNSQLLGYVRLAKTQYCFQMTNAGFVFSQYIENGQTSRMHQQFEELGLLVIYPLYFFFGYHIQIHECYYISYVVSFVNIYLGAR